MSDNKLGGVSEKTREALYALLDAMGDASTRNDETWAKAIRKLVKYGPKKALARMKKK